MNGASPRTIVVVDDDARRIAEAFKAVSTLNGEPPFALHVVTRGADSARKVADRLLTNGGRMSWLAAACRAIGAPAGSVSFSRRHVHVLGAGRPLGSRDVCSAQAVDWMVGFLRNCRRDTYAFDVVAGPSGVLRAALVPVTLGTVGTPDDRAWLMRAAGRARHARGTSLSPMTLVPIPFLPALPPERSSVASFSAELERRVEEWRTLRNLPPLVLDVPRLQVRIGEKAIALPPVQFFWYAAVATSPRRVFPLGEFRARLRCDDRGRAVVQGATPVADRLTSLVQTYRSLFAAIAPRRQDEFDRVFLNGCDSDAPQLPATLAKIGRRLRLAIGAAAARRYLARARKGEGVYALDIAEDQVAVIPRGRS